MPRARFLPKPGQLPFRVAAGLLRGARDAFLEAHAPSDDGTRLNVVNASHGCRVSKASLHQRTDLLEQPAGKHRLRALIDRAVQLVARWREDVEHERIPILRESVPPSLLRDGHAGALMDLQRPNDPDQIRWFHLRGGRG